MLTSFHLRMFHLEEYLVVLGKLFLTVFCLFVFTKKLPAGPGGRSYHFCCKTGSLLFALIDWKSIKNAF